MKETESIALINAKQSLLVSAIPNTALKDEIGDVTPGIKTYHSLQKQGLLYITEEDPIDIDGQPFIPTATVELTEKGIEILSHSSVG